MTAPRYQDIAGENLPELIDNDGTKVKVVIGKFGGQKSPVDGIATDP